MAYVVWVLRHSTHNGFPVVRGVPGSNDTEDGGGTQDFAQQGGGAGSREGPLEGVILRSQLMVLLTKRVIAPLPKNLDQDTTGYCVEKLVRQEVGQHVDKDVKPRWQVGRCFLCGWKLGSCHQNARVERSGQRLRDMREAEELGLSRRSATSGGRR